MSASVHSATQSATQFVYRFGNGTAEGSASQNGLLGGKGANLNEMSAIGLPVPAGYTITTEACAAYIENDGAWPDGLKEQVHDGIAHLEALMDQRFGDPENPLLVSVRSGAAVSMPGMMDTVLNLGLNDEAVGGLARVTGNERFAYDSYRRFIDMFGDVVMGVPHSRFEESMATLKAERGVESDLDLTAADLRDLVDRYKAVYRKATGRMFPDDPYEQLTFAVGAVFGSWTNERAVKYRAINGISGLRGTGVNVQAMVYGNKGDHSGTGVCFTRNPSTGAHALYGEFLLNAQGEDVVAGIRTPRAIADMQRIMPAIYDELVDLTTTLEAHYGNMQDIEFTVEEGTLYILQTRNGKRTGPAALRIATDMVREGLVDKKTAVRDLVEPRHLDQLLHPRFEDAEAYQEDVIGMGLPASPGAAVGRVIFSADTAEAWKKQGQSVILVRIETSPEDVGGMDAAEGILTSRGGMTSHAAVVARGWGKPCVAGCSDIVVNYDRKSFTNGEVTVHEGDWISLNGTTGEVVLGQHPLVDPDLSDDFATFMAWADAFRTMGVRANADTPADAQQARDFGAEGIGLCRTEHMFFGDERVRHMQEMILADTEAERRDALEYLLPYQRDDFAALFRAMDGLPVTVRLLDPPLHEFLPAEAGDQQQVADSLGVHPDVVREKVDAHREVNPMLGHRGCRLGITHPEITAMQARALFEAALAVQADGIRVRPEIMVPLVSTKAELENQRAVIERTAETVFAENEATVDYRVGSMIETPRAALQAGVLAEAGDFFSFGTNDLTQMAFGFSRDDVGSFLADYIERGILADDPFRVLDQEGVGAFVRIGAERGRAAKPDLQIGICGEHGGEPDSVAFCHRLGMHYVSCSPFRVPIARLAAAQAALEEDEA